MVLESDNLNTNPSSTTNQPLLLPTALPPLRLVCLETSLITLPMNLADGDGMHI